MRRFVTEYPNTGKMYASHVYADSYAHAQQLCWKRNISEVIVGHIEEPERKKELTEAEVLHESCFLSYICLKAGLITLEEVLGDGGIVHELSHTMVHNDNAHSIEELLVRVAWLRKLTPGYEPV